MPLELISWNYRNRDGLQFILSENYKKNCCSWDAFFYTYFPFVKHVNEVTKGQRKLYTSSYKYKLPQTDPYKPKNRQVANYKWFISWKRTHFQITKAYSCIQQIFWFCYWKKTWLLLKYKNRCAAITQQAAYGACGWYNVRIFGMMDRFAQHVVTMSETRSV